MLETNKTFKCKIKQKTLNDTFSWHFHVFTPAACYATLGSPARRQPGLAKLIEGAGRGVKKLIIQRWLQERGNWRGW